MMIFDLGLVGCRPLSPHRARLRFYCGCDLTRGRSFAIDGWSESHGRRCRTHRDLPRYVKDDRPWAAVAALGPERWLWVIWNDFEHWVQEPHCTASRAHGIAASRAAAEDAVRTVVPDPQWHGAGFASGWWRWRLAHARATRPGPDHGPGAVLSFVYNHWWSVPDDSRDPSHWSTSAHRIVRRTARFLYVEREAWFEGRRVDGCAPIHTLRLDRPALERGENVHHRSGGWWGGHWSLSEIPPERVMPVPACLATLGLDASATRRDVRRAYHRAVREAHPGGSAEAFRAVHKAYEMALRLCPAHPDGGR
jgi:hypothetical protein